MIHGNFEMFYDLEKYSVYDVRVGASTSVGEGKNASNEFRTAEDSEFYSHTFWIIFAKVCMTKRQNGEFRWQEFLLYVHYM